MQTFVLNQLKKQICSRSGGTVSRIAASQHMGPRLTTELTVCVKFHMFSPCLCGFPTSSQKRASMNVCVYGAGASSMVYYSLMSSAPDRN